MNLKEIYNSIIKKSNIEDRDYQKDFLTNEIYQTPAKPIVLGAGTSSGKTVMAIVKLIMFYLNPLNKDKKCLVIPAFQEILRDNFVEQLKDIEVKYGKLPFTYKIIKGYNSKQQIIDAMSDGVNVIICLPTTVNNHIKHFKNKIEWLYFDEAQYFYLAKMVQDMIKDIKPKYQLLMTGSVSKYNAKSLHYIIKHVPVNKLHELGLVSNVRVELIQSSYNFKDKDYISLFGKLKDGKTSNKDKNIEALYSVAKEMVLTLKSRFPNLVTNKYIGKRAIRVLGDIDKTIIICHSIQQAKCFYQILKPELKGKVLISHSKTDKEDWNNFEKFKTDDSKLLIVVNQGRIGFSMKELFNIVDFSMSKDFEIIQQMYGRLLRISDNAPGNTKIFYKVSTVDLAKWYEYVMRCVMCLMHIDWYSTYTGDKNQFKFPKKIQPKTPQPPQPPKPQKPKSNNFKISDEFPLDLNYVTYVEQNMKSKFATYAYWTLREAMVEMDGLKNSTPYTKQMLTDCAKNATTITELTKPIGLADINSFKRRCINSGNWYGYDGDKLFNEITKHIPRQFIWTEEEIRKDFKLNTPKTQSEYGRTKAGLKAKELNIFDKLAGHLPFGRIVWTDEMLKECAKSSNSREEMISTNYGKRAYDKLRTHTNKKFISECLSHWEGFINGKRFEWTKDLFLKKVNELGIKTKNQLREYNLRGPAQKFGIYDKFISTKK
jgi:superfamily II DNA or RNA helicase